MFTVDFLPTLPSLLTSRKVPLIHRDLSWLQFNGRVLDEARSPGNPLLERLKFLAISASNIDEFFMIRASSLERGIHAKQRRLEWRDARLLTRIRANLLETVAKFIHRQSETFEMLSPLLDQVNVRIVRDAKPGDPAFAVGRELFETQVLPKLLPPESFTFAKLNQLENLQVAAIFPGELWLKIPRSLPSILFKQVEVDGKPVQYFFFLDELLAQHVWPASTPWSPAFVRLTRDGDYSVDLADKDPESIPDEVLTRIGGREKGRPIRFQYSGALDTEFLKKCRAALKLTDQQILPAATSMYLHGLWTVVNNVPEDLPDATALRYPKLQSKLPLPFLSANIFDKLKERDYLLHHPYDSFDAYVEWIRAACEDPLVESIEQTVYRVDAVSPVINQLKEAAKHKKVRVVIELRARFDEMNNLRLADELEKAGVEVDFGFGSLKLHAKIALVTRREGDKVTLYTHLSTGNYNSSTARTYTDLAVLSANQEIGQDARTFLDAIYKGEVPQSLKHLVVAPTRLARRIRSLIHAEAEAARAGKPARIVAKVNALVDEGIIESLYEASRAGVQVDLIVRGACSLIPGVRGLSDNIRVVSIVDRFLEHSRIYYFANSRKMYLSSADWMPRNLFSRLEIAFPVLDPRLYEYLEQVVIPAYLSDTVKARELTHQGTWKKRSSRGSASNIRSQVFFRELAIRDYRGTPLEH